MKIKSLKIKNSQKGFTIQELLVVMGVMTILLGIVTLNLVTIQNRTNLNTAINTLVAEMKQQQIKAMAGDTEGRTTPDVYGVHFDVDKYTLFNGTTYSTASATNFDVELDDNMRFTSINLPNQSVIFNRVSGEIYNFNSSLSTVSLTNTTNNESQTIHFNRYGVITGIN